MLPLDLCDFGKHQQAVDKVMDHFKKVMPKLFTFFFCLLTV